MSSAPSLRVDVASLIDDRPTRYGSYAPENFDMSYQGTVTVRKALQLSLNVPAIALLDRVGPHRLTARIKQAGGELVLPKDETPGLAMGLGGVGITLSDLVQLYAGFVEVSQLAEDVVGAFAPEQVAAHVRVGGVDRDVLRRQALVDDAVELHLGDRRHGRVVAVQE